MAMTFDTTIHLGDIVMMAVGVMLTGVSWLMRRAYKNMAQFFHRIDGFDRRIEVGAEIIDEHSDVLYSANLAPHNKFERVSRRRRTTDVYIS